MKLRIRAGSTTLLALVAGLLPASVLPGILRAQTGGQSSGIETQTLKPGIRVAPVILAEPEVETSINIQIVPDIPVPRQTFLRLRGVPIAAKLSEGHVVAPGVWAVPLAALPSLRLLAPLASSGRTEIQIALVGVDGAVLAETKSSLVVAPAWLLGTAGQKPDSVRIVPRAEPGAPEAVVAVQPPAPTPAVEQRRAAPVATEPPPSPVTAAPPPPLPPVARPQPPAAPVMAALPPPAPLLAPPPPLAVVPPPPSPPPAAKTSPPAAPPPAAAVAPAPKSPPVMSAADKERAEALVQRGDVFLRQANVAAARQFFRRAADMGLAAGALRLGATYDPAELTARTIVGITPDPKEASIWYERARELGAPEAGARLSRLQGR